MGDPVALSEKNGAGNMGKSNANCILQLKGISKTFNGNATSIEVLKDVNCDIKRGETIAVVGASGIGKSTFLNIVGTLDRPDSGQLFFDGEDVFRYSEEKLAGFRNKSIGFVFQFHHLLPEFSAIENVMMPLFIAGQGKVDAKEKAESLLERVGLGERLTHRVTTLSGGEQQRVALARALAGDPSLLLADEPTGNLDKKNSLQVHDLLLSLNAERGMTLIVVTHNLELADQMERRITLTDGRLEELP